MPKMFELACVPISITVFWEAKSDLNPEPFWFAEVSFFALKERTPSATDSQSAKNAGVLIAKNLCRTNKVDIPARLDDPQWDEIPSTHFRTPPLPLDK